MEILAHVCIKRSKEKQWCSRVIVN